MRTKLLFLLLAMSFLALPYNSISAQEPIKNEATYTDKSTKFALMVSNVVHFQSALNTVEAMNIKKNNFTFEITYLRVIIPRTVIVQTRFFIQLFGIE